MKTRDEIKSEIQKKIQDAEALREQDISAAIGILEKIEQDLLPGFNVNRSDKPSVKNTTQDKQGQEILYLSKCGYILYEIENYEKALQHYNQFEKLLPNNNHKVAVYKAQGDCLRKLAIHDKALEKYEEGITVWQKDNSTDAKAKGALYNNRGLTYMAMEQYDKAILDFTEAIKVTSKVKEPNPLYYCNKGKAFIAKGQNSDALEVFKEAENLIEKGHLQKLVDAKNLTKENVSYITNTLKLIIKDEDNVLQMQEIISGLDKNSPETQKFIKFFEKYKDVVTTVVFMAASSLDKSEVNTKSQEQLKLRFDVLSMENSDLKKELGEYTRTLSTSLEVVTAMQSKVQGVSDTVEYLKERFDSGRRQTLKDYDVVLEDYLKSSDLSEENKIKIKEYYKAFTGTIASLYITAQVVDSGQVETKKGIGVTLTASLLPLISISGDFVKITSEPILALIKAAITGGANIIGKAGESIADDLTGPSAKVAKQNKQLANDSSNLSKQVSQKAIMIIENQYKQNQIINTTTEDLKKMPDNEILKLLKEKLKVEKLEISMKQVKKFLYGEMYSTVAEQLGHKDAKALIKQYLHTDNSHPQTDKSHAFKVAAQDIVKDGGFYVVSVDELHNEVSQGLFTNKLKELFNTTNLKSKLQNSLNKKIEEISDEEIKKVQIKHLNFSVEL